MISIVLLVEISGISLLLLVLVSDEILYPFPLHTLIEVSHLLKVFSNPWLLFAGYIITLTLGCDFASCNHFLRLI